jgi:hypothetical protein
VAVESECCSPALEHSSSSQPPLSPRLGYPDLHCFPLARTQRCSLRTAGRKDFLPVEPASCLSFLILLGRTKVRLKPLLLELYPSSSDEHCQRPIIGAALRGTPSRLSDSINRISRGITPLLPLRRDPRFNTHGRPPAQECRLRRKRPSLGKPRGFPSI